MVAIAGQWAGMPDPPEVDAGAALLTCAAMVDILMLP
jgi:hypothetical protein